MTDTIPNRDSIPVDHQWDLTSLFSSNDDWYRLFSEIEISIETYSTLRGRLSESVAIFRKAIEFDLALSRNLEKLYTYAHLKSDEDKSNQYYQGMHQQAMNLFTRASEYSSFMTPEIQSIPDDVMQDYLSDIELQEYVFYLEKILRYRNHTLSEEIEHILAMSGDMSQAASEIFTQLDNADITFGLISNETGTNIELSHGNFSTFLMNQSRDIRQRAFKIYYKAYDNHKNTYASSLLYSNKRDFFFSRVRRFENCRRAALFSDNVPDTVYDTLIDTVKQNLSPLFKYLSFRKKILELPEIHIYDTYVPIIKDISFNMPYEEAVETCVTALAVLGNEYTDTLKKGLLGGWVDRYENRGKRSGAYSSGCYDSQPYILMNYKDDNINSLYTLIHEAGHSMHSWLSNRHQSYIYHDYTIFVAEVASTFNEALLSRHLLNKYDKDQKMKAYVLNREIDNIRATLYRQTMFAEFEKLTHQVIEENKPLTLDTLRDIYGRLLSFYFENTIVIDEELTLECLRIPHFYSSFYVYKYATGISAAIALAGKVLSLGNPARDAYLNFLKLGGSRFPLDELREAGIDMEKPEPVQDAINYFNRLVEQLIELCPV